MPSDRQHDHRAEAARARRADRAAVLVGSAVAHLDRLGDPVDEERHPAREEQRSRSRCERGRLTARSSASARCASNPRPVDRVGRWRSPASSCSRAAPRWRSRVAAARRSRRRPSPRGPRSRLPALRRVPVRRPRQAGARRDRAPPARARRRRGGVPARARGRARAAVAGAAAEYLGVERGELAFTDSTTMGLGLVYSGCSARATRSSPPSTTTTRPTRRCGCAGATVRGSRSTTTPRGHGRRDDRPPARRDHAAHEGRRADVGAFRHRRQAAGARARRRRAARRRRRRARARRRRPAASPATCSSPAPTSGWADRAAPAWSGRATGREIAATIPSFDVSDEPGPRFTPGGWHSFEHRWALAEAFES